MLPWLLLLAALVAADETCEVSEGDDQGMLQLQAIDAMDRPKAKGSKASKAGPKRPKGPKAKSSRPYGSGKKFTPDVWAPRFNATAGGPALQMSCEGDSFLDCWTFFTTADPTHGYVQYVDEETATSTGLFKVEDGAVYMGAAVGQNQPVKSIRLQSQMRFSEGHIFVIDIAHMPTGMSTWPAWWSYGPDWPNNGEIDTIETVNIEDHVQQTLHTSYGCWMNIPNIFNPDCNSADAHNGCGLDGPPNSGGPAFNSAGGGVFATQWTSTGIKMWVFPRGQIPADLAEDQPDSASWGNPWAFFPFGDSCPSTHFSDHVLVINLDFCGDWAGSVFPGGESACEAFVKDPSNVDQLQDAFWRINYVKVFAADSVGKTAGAKTSPKHGRKQGGAKKGRSKSKGKRQQKVRVKA